LQRRSFARRGGRGQQPRLQKAADAVRKLAGERFTSADRSKARYKQPVQKRLVVARRV
jgi:hypothetical protein